MVQEGELRQDRYRERPFLLLLSKWGGAGARRRVGRGWEVCSRECCRFQNSGHAGGSFLFEPVEGGSISVMLIATKMNSAV